MLVTMKELVDEAYEGGYAVPAPNVDNEHNLRAAIEAAEELNSPVIIGHICGYNPDIQYFGRIATDLARRAKVKVAINLDHGGSFEDCMAGIQAGFTSIMIDRSQASFEDNIREVAELAKAAHALGITVEAELGHVGVGQNYAVDGKQMLTNPEEALQFVQETNVDCLAVAVGTAHGVYQGEPHIRFELLEELTEKIPVPLVLHGGSGSGDENLRRCAKLGICKVNLSNDLRKAAIESLVEQDLNGDGAYEMYNYLAAGFKSKLKHYIELLGSKDKCGETNE
ncbi:class II fructose-bisphosphate aldolase [Candidatus Enterococcus ferrettii]|uniref:Fructose-bisphosphate aldolase, class II n=1 Tax=Candidatus Enterococcus ferrettii TaxID=2815324 RepID=A0ABV0ESS0_9ENTE|nr:class II fructose-bisphosphate aldolase [Enterococcus sp. 665A]MBO1342387.1 class II fructose-bisphosphate aldolase [Enterococcus sp. 665A]